MKSTFRILPARNLRILPACKLPARNLLIAACTLLFSLSFAQAEKVKALMITGEGYHDYEAQKKIISEGTAARMDIEWTIIHDKNAADCKVNLSKPGWADPYDVVLYNICHAKETDAAFIASVTKVHEAGKPAIALHCTMHSFHWDVETKDGEEADWVKFLGVYSRNHGPKAPIKVTKVKKHADHPVVKDLPEGWTTPDGELYNIGRVLDTATVLAHGDNGKVKNPQACIWINKHGKGKVVGTTIGHHNSTMESKEYLDLLTSSIKWAVAK